MVRLWSLILGSVFATLPTSSVAVAPVISLTLVNAATGVDVGPVFDGIVIDLLTLPLWSIRANVSTPVLAAHSMGFTVDGATNHIDNNGLDPNFAMEGNANGNYIPVIADGNPVVIGCQDLLAAYYDQTGATGNLLARKKNRICIERSTLSPSSSPSETPSASPSESPSKSPSAMPVKAPTTKKPTNKPTSEPSSPPSMGPSSTPSASPSESPSSKPSTSPSASPSARPVKAPITNKPTNKPTSDPSSTPSLRPSSTPSASPSKKPSSKPSAMPSAIPSARPVKGPTKKPTKTPTRMPTKKPTAKPIRRPTRCPTKNPIKRPTKSPTRNPTKKPTHACPTASRAKPPLPAIAPTIASPKSCLADNWEALGGRGTLTCAAKDVTLDRISAIRSPSLLTSSCAAGSLVAFDTLVASINFSTGRFDFGFYLGLDGGNAQRGTCLSKHLLQNETSLLQISPSNSVTWINSKDNDACGDVFVGPYGTPSKGIMNVTVARNVSLPCVDTDDDGLLDVSLCITWGVKHTDASCQATPATVGRPLPKSGAHCACASFAIPQVAVTCPSSTAY